MLWRVSFMQGICQTVDSVVLAACESVIQTSWMSRDLIKAECCDKERCFSLWSQRFVKPNKQKIFGVMVEGRGFKYTLTPQISCFSFVLTLIRCLGIIYNLWQKTPESVLTFLHHFALICSPSHPVLPCGHLVMQMSVSLFFPLLPYPAIYFAFNHSFVLKWI